MTAPAHYAIGAASALFVQSYLLSESSNETRIFWALIVAIISHIAADLIPHTEHFLRGRYLALELVAETILMLGILVSTSRSPFITIIILVGMIGVAIPDGLGMLRHYVNWPVLSWVDSKLHLSHGKFNLLYANFWTQLIITILCSYYVRIKAA